MSATAAPKTISQNASLLSFKPTRREVLTGIAPHLFKSPRAQRHRYRHRLHLSCESKDDQLSALGQCDYRPSEERRRREKRLSPLARYTVVVGEWKEEYEDRELEDSLVEEHDDWEKVSQSARCSSPDAGKDPSKLSSAKCLENTFKKSVEVALKSRLAKLHNPKSAGSMFRVGIFKIFTSKAIH